VVQAVAEQAGMSQQAVRRAAEKASEAIAEPVDLERDSPAELRRKADEVKAAAPTRAKAKAKPKPRLDLVASLRQLEADWPMQLDAAAFAAEMPAFRRDDLGKTVRRLRIRLEELEAALTPSPVN
jgi:hypothetical protein